VRAAFYGRLACRMSGTPLLSSVHDMLTWKNYPHDRQLIAVSEAVKGHLLARGFDAGRIKVVPRCPGLQFRRWARGRP
jgi:hypothetical protein